MLSDYNIERESTLFLMSHQQKTLSELLADDASGYFPSEGMLDSSDCPRSSQSAGIAGIDIFDVFIKIPAGETINVRVEPWNTIHDVKMKIHGKHGVPADRYGLALPGCDEMLADCLTLIQYNIQKCSTLCLHQLAALDLDEIKFKDDQTSSTSPSTSIAPQENDTGTKRSSDHSNAAMESNGPTFPTGGGAYAVDSLVQHALDSVRVYMDSGSGVGGKLADKGVSYGNEFDNRSHSFSVSSSGLDSGLVKSYENVGYDNEEDYLFDQYGGIGGTNEERAELAKALIYTLNVGPMADDLFYEEVAMCFLRCRERHRMRTTWEGKKLQKKKQGADGANSANGANAKWCKWCKWCK
mmetsp:Transcript_8999/g.15658  ORF Transcript_8999/g.15658 Transcript_8999/m.15658 type:complete len:354 (-) Transcript_8999:1896-2957(-)